MKVVVTVLSVLLVILVSTVGFFIISRKSDFSAQRRQYGALESEGAVRENLPDDFLDDSLPINRIRLLATHNSSHKQADPLRLFLVERGESGEAVKLKYSHPSLYRQMDLGIRSFEMDLRYRAGRFENTHVPLVDDRSGCPDFQLALQEIRLWSDRHPSHVPLIVLIEIKEDWTMLDPRLAPWNGETLILLDETIESVLGDRVLRPGEIRGSRESVRDGAVLDGWPLLGESRGKVLFALMADNPRDDLFTPAFMDRPERISFLMAGPDSLQTAFVKRDDPSADDIGQLVEQGIIVRSRADADLDFGPGRKAAAVASGAQIVSTDFPDGYDTNPDEYSVGWGDLHREID